MKTKIALLGLLALVHSHLSAESRIGCASPFVAHEWGTFTSVQGADGVQLEWNPFIVEELPRFVYGLKGATPFLDFSKTAFVSLQRMETPVIYFYSDRERAVDVTVRFPQGRVTEWYPQVAKPKQPVPLFWDDVHILPTGKAALPAEASGSHYYAAREAGANLLQVQNGGKTENETFLFYRGVGNFLAPLKVTTGSSAARLQLKNTGADPLSHLYVLHVQKGTGKFIYLSGLAPGKNQSVNLDLDSGRAPMSDVQAQIIAQMKKSLEAEGLYEAEARAMVKTWQDSWFGEEGLRVLYLLPRSWTDRTLPLTIEPQPDSVTRVMVGRAEVIVPEVEWKILKQIVRFSDGDDAGKVKSIAELRDLGVGRFADAIVRRWLGKTPSAEFSQAGWGLLDRMYAAERATPLALHNR